MKKKYFEMEMDVINLYNIDVITASEDSDVTDDPYKPGGGSGDWWNPAN